MWTFASLARTSSYKKKPREEAQVGISGAVNVSLARTRKEKRGWLLSAENQSSLGRPAGSVARASLDSGSRGCEFEPHAGRGDRLKIKSLNNKQNPGALERQDLVKTTLVVLWSEKSLLPRPAGVWRRASLVVQGSRLSEASKRLLRHAAYHKYRHTGHPKASATPQVRGQPLTADRGSESQRASLRSQRTVPSAPAGSRPLKLLLHPCCISLLPKGAGTRVIFLPPLLWTGKRSAP